MKYILLIIFQYINIYYFDEMRLEKLLWSKAKSDIIKYLVFKRQGVSMRALETDMEWTFPAIKKQIDILEEADIVQVEKTDLKWSITLREDFGGIMKSLYLLSLKTDIKKIFESYPGMIDRCLYGQIFGADIQLDLAIIHNGLSQEFLDQIKNDIWINCKDYFIDNISLLFMPTKDFENRNRVWDRFVINLLQKCKS